MNRKQLLALLRGQGCPDSELSDVAKAKAWAAANGIELVDGKGKSIDFDAVWKKTVALKLDDAEDSDDADDDNDGGTATATKVKSKRTRTDDAEDDAGDDEDGSTRQHYVPGKGWRDGPGKVDGSVGKAGRLEKTWERKQYNYRASHGHTVWADADTAENFAAEFRMLCAAACRLPDYSLKSRDLEIRGKAGSTNVNTNSGILVSPEFNDTLIWLTERYSVARRVANVQKMQKDEKIVRRKTGIFSMSHIAENGTFTATNNTYDAVTLNARKVGALIQDSTELLEDSDISIADDYARTFAEAQGKREDQDFILGDGSATYGGHVGLNNAPWMTFFDATGTTWGEHVEADILAGMIGAVENVDASRLAFLGSRQYFTQVIMRIANGKGGTTPQAILNASPVYGNSMGGEPDAYAWGWPFYFAQVMPTATATTQKCLFFGDFVGGAMLGDRRALGIKTSEHYAFNADQITVLGTSRIAVNIHGDGRGTTTGPIVGLKTS